MSAVPTPTLPPNIVRDRRTVAAMVDIYCHHHHADLPRSADGGDLCADCASLMAYADVRLSKCPFGPEKTTCRECPVHCYRPAERATMKQVMIFSGPRMLWRHPWLAVRHLWLERKGAPPWPPKARAQKTSNSQLQRSN